VKKSDKIKSEIKNMYNYTGAIFIDNEFPERTDVSLNCIFPVFNGNGLDFVF